MTTTVLEGRATPQATASLPNRLGKTELGCSRLGFGSYRIDPTNPNHRQALKLALQNGVNLIDTSTNYSDGGSEQAIGEVLVELVEQGQLSREQVVVVTKIGYVQGRNYERAVETEAQGHPIPEMVKMGPGLWHCIHPDFLKQQLEHSLARLQMETVDVLLLHNPEYFLMEAAANQAELEASRTEFYDRLRKAFAYLESEVQAGRIGCYGVSSNTCVRSLEAPESSEVHRFLKAAEASVGAEHHFRVLQLPLNLLEWEGVARALDQAREADLAVMVNRPLNAYSGQELVRLAALELEEEEEDFEQALTELEAQEDLFQKTFRPFLEGPDVQLLFQWAPFLRDAPDHLQGIEHWLTLEELRIRPHLAAMLEVMEAASEAGFEDRWQAWKEDYTNAFRGVCNAIEELATRRSFEKAQKVVATVDPHLPAERKPETLSRKALWIATSVPGVDVVLNGMRRVDYVEDSLAVLDWQPLAEVEQLLTATSKLTFEP